MFQVGMMITMIYLFTYCYEYFVEYNTYLEHTLAHMRLQTFCKLEMNLFISVFSASILLMLLQQINPAKFHIENLKYALKKRPDYTKVWSSVRTTS